MVAAENESTSETTSNEIEFGKPVYSSLVESHFVVAKKEFKEEPDLETVFENPDVGTCIIEFLQDDGLSVGRLSMSSKTLYEIFTNSTHSFDPWLQLYKGNYANYMNDSSENIKWEKIRKALWVDGKKKVHDGDLGEPITDINRHKFIHRYCLDKSAKSVVRSISRDLEVTIFAAEHANIPANAEGGVAQQIDYSPFFFGPDSTRIGQAWNDASWSQLLTYGPDIIDHLRRIAQPTAGEGEGEEVKAKVKEYEILKKVNRFVAAQALRNMYSAESLFVWKDQMGDFSVQTSPDAPGDRWRETIGWIEKYAILISKIHQPLEELLQRKEIEKFAVDGLDEISAECKRRLDARAASREKLTIVDSLQELNKIVFEERRYYENVGDIYNYKASLLTHALATQKGSSLTLSILYGSLCRRLDIKTGIVRLKSSSNEYKFLSRVYGTVEGGDGDEDPDAVFVNVSGSGRQWSVKDCKEVAGDNWVPTMTKPLTAKKIITNLDDHLTSCHTRQIQNNNENTTESNPYATEMRMPQQCLNLLGKQQDSMVMPLLDKFAKDMPLVLARGTLSFYNLIKSENEGGTENENEN